MKSYINYMKHKTPFFNAAAKGKVAILKYFIDNNLIDDINKCDENGFTVLYYASINGHEEAVQVLLDSGAKADCVLPDGRSLFGVICEDGQINLATKFLSKNPEIVDIKNTKKKVSGNNLIMSLYLGREYYSNWTPLMHVAYKGNIKLAELLLKKGAKTEQADSNGKSAIWFAASAGHAGMVRYLADHNAYVSVHDKSCGNEPIHAAALNGHKEVVRLLLPCYQGDEDQMYNEGERKSFDPKTEEKVKESKMPCDRLNVDVANWDDETLLWLALHGNKEKASRCNFSIKDLKYISSLTNKDIDAFVKNFHNNSPLIKYSLTAKDIGALARNLNYEELEYSRQKEQLENSKEGALSKEHRELVEFLIQEGADVESSNKNGSKSLGGRLYVTPLMLACEKGYMDAAEILVNNGADINAQDSLDNTPLHLALRKGFTKLALFLVAKGANTDIMNKNRKSPIDVIERADKTPYYLKRIKEARMFAEHYEGKKCKLSYKEIIIVLDKVRDILREKEKIELRERFSYLDNIGKGSSEESKNEDVDSQNQDLPALIVAKILKKQKQRDEAEKIVERYLIGNGANINACKNEKNQDVPTRLNVENIKKIIDILEKSDQSNNKKPPKGGSKEDRGV